MSLKSLLAAACFVCLFGVSAYAVVPTQDEPIAILRALDKITARVEQLEITENQPFKFDTITITVRACRVTQPEETPEAAAFLEISELKPGENDTPVFHGWMFASSPALSAMEHPVYDIWVIGCKGTPEAAPAGAPATSPAAAPAANPAPAAATPQAQKPAPQKPAAR